MVTGKGRCRVPLSFPDGASRSKFAGTLAIVEQTSVIWVCIPYNIEMVEGLYKQPREVSYHGISSDLVVCTVGVHLGRLLLTQRVPLYFDCSVRVHVRLRKSANIGHVPTHAYRTVVTVSQDRPVHFYCPIRGRAATVVLILGFIHYRRGRVAPMRAHPFVLPRLFAAPV